MSGIKYTLVRKNVKNINLRINAKGEVAVSANKKISISKIDEFVESKAKWIEAAQKRAKERNDSDVIFSDEECLKKFNDISDMVFSLFKKYLDVKPLIKVRQMKSWWGVCHYKKGYIVLNKALMSKPLEAIEYVVLHEYIHFFEPNHQAKFYKIMAQFMPDYEKRRKMLRQHLQ